jgi:hypothetical protein
MAGANQLPLLVS